MEAPPTVLVASIGIPDTLLLVLLALVVFGPRRLAEIGRQAGKLVYEFRKMTNDFKSQMEEELRTSQEAELEKKMQSATSGTRIEQDLPARLDDTGKSGAGAHPEAIRGTGMEANHA